MEIVFNNESKKLVSAEIAWHYKIVPFNTSDELIQLYIEEASNAKDTVVELEILFKRKVELIPKPFAVIEQALNTHYIKNEARRESSSLMNFDVSDKDFIYVLIREAKMLRSSDIHIESYEHKSRIRLRIDGKLIERFHLKKTDYPALINKIKIMSGLDISEKRLSQDGRIFFHSEDLRFDIRVSVLPTLYGEKIVLRILGNDVSSVTLKDLGFSKLELERYSESIKRPNGIVLISGPTGSGKTTTLYATLQLLNKVSDNILTVEDPIEYTMEGVNQVQVKEDIGLTFSSALRTFLRQDPDVIMVGEIRDSETAQLAIRAALTGHLVLSTIHTNSAWGTISRLIDIGIPPFLLAKTMNATVAQRLVRQLCEHCKAKEAVVEEMWPPNFKNRDFIKEHYRPVGCKECFYTGYRGRKAIYEVIPVDSQVSQFILNGYADSAYFKSLKIKTLQQSAFDLLCGGTTSIEEIYPLLLDEQY